jgi:molybdopterin-guanine dinucleotide biosynthesis protein
MEQSWSKLESEMAIVVVGGHTRNIGKTSVVAGLIRALPEMRWTAFKITQFGHGVCSANGEPCDCETAEHTIAISEERDPATGTDSARYLAAGAARSFWVRTRQGQLAEAMPRLRKEFERAQADNGNVIIESNSILRFLRPDVFLTVLDPATADFKPSALRYLDRADAVLIPAEEIGRPAWDGVSLKLIEGVPRFQIRPPEYVTAEISEFVTAKLMLAKQFDRGATQRHEAAI